MNSDNRDIRALNKKRIEFKKTAPADLTPALADAECGATKKDLRNADVVGNEVLRTNVAEVSTHATGLYYYVRPSSRRATNHAGVLSGGHGHRAG